jgi:hypothetical protein
MVEPRTRRTQRDRKGGTTLSITALGIAVAYLLIIVAGALGALLAMIWLFGDAPGRTTSTARETVKDLRNAGRFPVEPERSEDRAA